MNITGDEIPAKGLSLGSLDKTYFDTFLQKHFNTSLDNLDIPLETLLENMNLMQDGVFNVAGVPDVEFLDDRENNLFKAIIKRPSFPVA